MPGNRRALAGLTLLLAILGLIAWFEPGLAPPPAPERRQLTTIAPESIEQLRLQRGDLTLAFARRDGNWWLHGEQPLPANRFRIDKLLGLLTADERDRFPLGERDPADFGLAPPVARLTYGPRLELEVGGETPLGDARYLQLGEQLHLVDSAFYFYLLGEPVRFIAPALLPPGWQLKAIAAQLTGGNWQLSQADGRWHAEPQGLIESADQAVALFDQWRLAQALQLSFLEAPVVANESLTLKLEDAHGVAHSLRFLLQRGERHWQLIREDAALAYLLPAESAAALLTPPVPAEIHRTDSP